MSKVAAIYLQIEAVGKARLHKDVVPTAYCYLDVHAGLNVKPHLIEVIIAKEPAILRECRTESSAEDLA